MIIEERTGTEGRKGQIKMNDKTTIAFTGDIGFDKYMDRKWEDEKLLAPEIVQFLTSADHVVANVEGPLVDNTATLMQAAEMRLMHTINPAAVKVLRDIDADIWNLCNNHIMDAGPEGLAMTLREAEKFGAKTLGVGMNLKEAAVPVILDEAGGIGLLGVGYQRGCKPAGEEKAGCVSWSDMETIRNMINEIKAKCRWCVVVSHGGEEFTAIPSPYTRERYLKFLEMGADLVVSHHPHVPMNYETVGDKMIFYSLGNFIFDTDYQRAQYNTEKGLLLKIHFTEAEYSFEAFGLKINRENERIESAPLPKIFADIQEEDYNKLEPLAAKMFLAATKRQQLFLYPDKFKDATEEQWKEHFYEPKRSGRVPGEALDFQIIYPIAQEEAKGAWRECELEDIKAYILEQME